MSINGRKIHDLRYADDTTLQEDEIVELLKRMEKTNEKYGFKINATKNKILSSTEQIKREINIAKD